MKIGGFLKTSTIDYPGHASSVIYTVGCNMACAYCHNHRLVTNSTDEDFTTDNVLQTIKNRKRFIKHIVITGGEPTIHSDLIGFISKIKKLGFKIKLDTNGSNPDVLCFLIKEKLIDYVAMDIKGPLENYEHVVKLSQFKNSVPMVKRILESINVLKEDHIDYEFRTTMASPMMSTEFSDLVSYGELVHGATRVFLQMCNDKDTLNDEFKSLNREDVEKVREYLIQAHAHICEIR